MIETLLRVRGISVRLFQSSNGKHPLLLLPSAGGQARDFNEIFPLLAEGTPVTSLDYPGFGASEIDPEIQRIEDLPPFIKCLMEVLDSETFYLLGYSMGGWIALQLALSFPNLVQKLILVATSSHPFKELPIQNIGGLKYKEILDLLYFDPEVKRKKAYAKLNRKEKEEIHRSTQALKSLLQFKDSQPDLTPFLNKIRNPTLILAPEFDPLIPREFQFDLGKAIPKSHLVYLKDTGHALIQEKPKEISEIITTFLYKN
ncbi:MAG TPA: alpha/beta hydrolase [Nitrospiria bacterium]|jgi:pimeloyl-ACP methyl ester carboxylesterase